MATSFSGLRGAPSTPGVSRVGGQKQGEEHGRGKCTRPDLSWGEQPVGITRDIHCKQSSIRTKDSWDIDQYFKSIFNNLFIGRVNL